MESRTDRSTDRRTDEANYRVACTQLKIIVCQDKDFRALFCHSLVSLVWIHQRKDREKGEVEEKMEEDELILIGRRIFFSILNCLIS